MSTSTAPDPMRLLLPASLALLLTACGDNRLPGQATDHAGQPLEGATVTVLGTTCQEVTDAEGRFRIGCTSPERRLVISQQGYVTVEVPLTELPTEGELGTHALYRVPEGQGFFRIDGAEYEELQRAWLTRRSFGAGNRDRSWCLDEAHSTATVAPAGQVELFINGRFDWRAFRLDEHGCALSRFSEPSGPPRTEATRWEPTQVRLADTQEVLTDTLEPGEYFISDWHQGSPRRAQGPGVPEGERRFGGWWLSVR